MNIYVKDEVLTKDVIHTFRRWIGRAIGFFTVKINPPVHK